MSARSNSINQSYHKYIKLLFSLNCGFKIFFCFKTACLCCFIIACHSGIANNKMADNTGQFNLNSQRDLVSDSFVLFSVNMENICMRQREKESVILVVKK